MCNLFSMQKVYILKNYCQQNQEKLPVQHYFIFEELAENVITFVRMWSFLMKKNIVNLTKTYFFRKRG